MRVAAVAHLKPLPSSLPSISCVANMSLSNENNALGEKPANGVPAYEPATLAQNARGRQFSTDPEDRAIMTSDQNLLHRDLKGRHMQMIAM